MNPNRFIKKIKEYPLVSHKAWDIEGHVLKMDWNEADVKLPRTIKKAVTDFINKGRVQWYPDVFNSELISSISRYVGVPRDSIQYFVGEDSALDYVVRTFVAEGDEVAIVSPTYDNFRVYVESMGAIPKYIKGKNIFDIDVDLIAKNISKVTKMVYMVNPNNPTGTLYSKSDIEKLLKKFPKVLFIIDEAYYEFSRVTVALLVKKYNNLVVGRSLSKAFGLASFRLGYLLTSPENLIHINKIRNGKNTSALSQIAAIEALKDTDYMSEYIKEVRLSMNFLTKELQKLGFRVRPTLANFLLIEVSDAQSFRQELEKNKIFVRSLSHLEGMEDYARITVGNMSNTKKFLSIISKLFKNGQIKP